MFSEPRKYRDSKDIEAMCDLLMQGRKANNGTYYIHPGDLRWWLYYPSFDEDYRDETYVWESPVQQGQLSGWALISKNWVGWDVYVQPELRGSAEAEWMYHWAEERAALFAREKGKRVHSLWVFHDDEALDGYLRQHGYYCTPGYVHLKRSLDEAISTPELAGGWTVRNCLGELEVTGRAKAQAGAFHSAVPFERYLERFTNFMRSPVYDRELDIIAVREDGQVGAFCIVWTDPINCVGLFEPVGTHPDYQRQGLGRAVMEEGLRCLQARGMKSAIVSAETGNVPAIRLYEEAGFQVINHLGIYEKEV